MHFVPADYDTLVFDCDGVILDSNRIKTEAFLSVTLPFGEAAARNFLDYHRRHGGISRNEKFAYFIDAILGTQATGREELLARLLEAYAAICARELLRCPLIPGVAALLAALPERVRAHVVTGGAQAEVREVFAARGLSRHFSSVLGSPTSKRDNMRALAAAGAFRGRALYFGDAELDMRLAEEFGLEFVYVYGVSEWPDGRAHCPHPQIADFRELGFREPAASTRSPEGVPS
jgi:phosphoglycolate phosphatase-like HAD superfamily hydrolase